jgi:quinol monooxygenase YgiN
MTLEHETSRDAALQVYVISTWKDDAAVESHLKQPHVQKFFEQVKKFDVGIEITRFKPAIK